MLRIARFLGIDQKCNEVAYGHSTPLKISCKSVQPFSRNLTDKETKKSIEINTSGRGNKVITEDPQRFIALGLPQLEVLRYVVFVGMC